MFSPPFLSSPDKNHAYQPRSEADAGGRRDIYFDAVSQRCQNATQLSLSSSLIFSSLVSVLTHVFSFFNNFYFTDPHYSLSFSLSFHASSFLLIGFESSLEINTANRVERRQGFVPVSK